MKCRIQILIHKFCILCCLLKINRTFLQAWLTVNFCMMSWLLKAVWMVFLKPTPLRSMRNFAAYQGFQRPMLMLSNSVVFALKCDKVPYKLVFNLGFAFSDADDDVPGQACSMSSSTQSSAVSKIYATQKSSWVYHEPCQESQMDSLAHNKFAPETEKKICWLTNMYHQWQIQRNKNPELVHIFADLDDIPSLTKRSLSYRICRFITEIKKLNGGNFPPKTIYEIVVCMQMFLESKGIFWKLLDDKEEEFQCLRYTSNNIIKERGSGGIGSVTRQAEVISYDDYFLWQNGFLGCDSPE